MSELDESEIDFDKNIITDIDNLLACREILQKMLKNTELADVTLIAGIDGVR